MTAPSSTQIPHSSLNRFSLPSASFDWLAANPPLLIATIASLTIGLVAVAGLALDPRLITGVPAWIKPFKFAISIAVYCLTLVWLLSFIEGYSRLRATISYATAVSLVVELAIITLQVLRGTTSHFNRSTPFDAALWSAMGAFVMLIALANLATAILLIRQKLPDAAFAWSLRLGVLISFVGMGVAYFMTSTPSPAQQAVIEAGQKPASLGAHSVGVEDGGPGLPLLGWSTVGGDLRVPHFFGLHAMQLLPLLGYLLSRRKELRADQRVKLIWTAGLGYLGLVLIFTWQALRGQSIIAPDWQTLTVFGLWIIGLVGAGLISLRPSGAARLAS